MLCRQAVSASLDCCRTEIRMPCLTTFGSIGDVRKITIAMLFPGENRCAATSLWKAPGRLHSPISTSSMVQKCANPSCSARFLKLGVGRLFVVESPARGQFRRQRCFWLCDACCRSMTLLSKNDDEGTTPTAARLPALSPVACDYDQPALCKAA